MDGIASNSFQMKMDRSNHHRVAQVEESDAMKTMMMTLMEKFDAFSSSSPRETLPPLVQEQQGVQEVNYMGKQNFQGGNYNQGKPNFQSQQQGQFPQNTQGRYNANSNFQGGSSYNPNFKSHENFSYANQRAAVQFPPGFNPGAKPPNNEGRPSQDDAMEAMFKKMDEFMKGTSSHIKSLEQQMGNQIKTLEHQMGQLASTVGEQHQRGKFPSTTETNPKEHCKAIKLRSGTKYDGPSNPLDEEEKVQEEKEEVNEDPLEEEEEELELAKEDEEEKGMGTELKKKKEQEKMKEKAEEEVRVPKWREAKEKKQDTKEVELDHWGVPKIGVPFPQREQFCAYSERFFLMEIVNTC
ncbi:hypothetical protein ACS0TY_011706 [Phlomoides rotata]